jgi:hypothetical protein
MKSIVICLIILEVALWNAGAEELGPEKNLASTILTQALAERILSRDVEPAAGNNQPDGGSSLGKMRVSHCSYATSASVPGKQASYLDFTLRQLETAALAKAQFESLKIVYRGKDVSGVGEAAFRPTSPSQLHVLKGRFYIVVTAPAPNMEENAAAEILRRLRD